MSSYISFHLDDCISPKRAADAAAAITPEILLPSFPESAAEVKKIQI